MISRKIPFHLQSTIAYPEETIRAEEANKLAVVEAKRTDT